MSTLLENVRRAQTRRREAESAFRDAVIRARKRHSLSELADAARMSRSGIQHLFRRYRKEGHDV